MAPPGGRLVLLRFRPSSTLCCAVVPVNIARLDDRVLQIILTSDSPVLELDFVRVLALVIGLPGN
jgi:hypothetical protein